MNHIICQVWEESERDWGVRPDGFTLHLTPEDHAAFMEDFWRQQKADFDGRAPDEYTRASGKPYACPVNDVILAEVAATDNGLWCHDSAPWPASGGGWKTDSPTRLDEPEATLD